MEKNINDLRIEIEEKEEEIEKTYEEADRLANKADSYYDLAADIEDEASASDAFNEKGDENMRGAYGNYNETEYLHDEIVKAEEEIARQEFEQKYGNDNDDNEDDENDENDENDDKDDE